MADRRCHLYQRFAAPLVEGERAADENQRQDEDQHQEAADAHGAQRLSEGKRVGNADFMEGSDFAHAYYRSPASNSLQAGGSALTCRGKKGSK